MLPHVRFCGLHVGITLGKTPDRGTSWNHRVTSSVATVRLSASADGGGSVPSAGHGAGRLRTGVSSGPGAGTG
jgi:hypothetical protein